MIDYSIDIGENIFIPKEYIIAILDSETMMSSKTSRKFLNQNKDKISHYTKKKLKTYIITYSEENLSIYQSSIASVSMKNKFKVKGLKEKNE